MGLVFYSGSFLTGSDEDINYNSAIELGSIGASEINDAIQILINSQSLGTLTSSVAIYITGSSPDPLVGMGTTNPLSNLDIRSTTGSSPANLILRTNEDGVIQVGEETGRIIFAIESASFLGTGFIASGSTSAIYSEVIGSNINGAYGGLIFEVNDSSNVTTPIKALTIGYGLGASSNDVGFVFSGSIKSTAGANSLSLLSSTNDNTLAYLGFSGVSDLPELDRGMLLLNDDGNTHVRLNGAAGSTDFLNTGNNVAIGTTTAPEKLTVEGSISASGDIIGNINGGSF